MKPYGVRRGDQGCCPGHDKFPGDSYSNRRSKKAQTRDTQVAHQVARSRGAADLRRQVDDANIDQ